MTRQHSSTAFIHSVRDKKLPERGLYCMLWTNTYAQVELCSLQSRKRRQMAADVRRWIGFWVEACTEETGGIEPLPACSSVRPRKLPGWNSTSFLVEHTSLVCKLAWRTLFQESAIWWFFTIGHIEQKFFKIYITNFLYWIWMCPLDKRSYFLFYFQLY